MIELPATDVVPVLRTDFSNAALWTQLEAELLAPAYDGSGYEAPLEFVDRNDLARMDTAELDGQIPRGYPSSYEHPFVVIVDAVTMGSPDHPVLVVDLSELRPNHRSERCPGRLLPSRQTCRWPTWLLRLRRQHRRRWHLPRVRVGRQRLTRRGPRAARVSPRNGRTVTVPSSRNRIFTLRTVAPGPQPTRTSTGRRPRKYRRPTSRVPPTSSRATAR
jgi:hypothetical protein